MFTKERFVLRSFSLAVLTVVALLAGAGTALAGTPARWIRYPAISPDGGTIAFSFQGDIWKVASTGGEATPLTRNAAHETYPVWSPDGSRIAFASDRFGNFDVFVMPAAGGPARRLTFHSASDRPTSFTPDGNSVLFSSARLDAPDCVQFPTGAQPELYRVALEGGMPEQILTTPALYAVYDESASRLAYSDLKGYEGPWRKHDDSAFARDVWIYDVKGDTHTRLTAFGADDRQPVWGPDNESLFYLSERSGSFNVWRLPVGGGSPEQITRHEKDPVRFLSASKAGALCYAFRGDLYLRPAGAAASAKLDVMVAAGGAETRAVWRDVGDQITEIALSPGGKEVAFVARGEVFVTSVGHPATRRITDTPEQERSVSFSPDGRSLLYASERNGSWNIYRSDLTDEKEVAFWSATAIEEKPVLVGPVETLQPHFSPDGKQVAYFEDRTTLKVLDLETGKTRTVLPGDLNYSYSDGDQWYEWSPDGKWFLVEFLSPTRWSAEVGLVPASGEGDVVNLTHSGYDDLIPRWGMKGTMMFWAADRHGSRAQGGRPVEHDIYGAFFTPESWDRFNLSQAEYEQLVAQEKKEKKKGGRRGKNEEEASSGDEEEEPVEPVKIQLAGLDDRKARLTLHSARLVDAALTPDGEKLVYLARYEKGYDLWTYEHRSKKIKRVAELGAKRGEQLLLDKKGKKAFVLADHKISVVDLEKGKTKPVPLKAKMRLRSAEERAYFFEHAWRQTKEKFYVADLHGVDWDGYRSEYAEYLPYIDNNIDFAELISELQGELNASHMGCRYRPRRKNPVETASLGLFPDMSYRGPGIKIAEVIEKGPLQQAGTRIKASVVIEAIDGQPIPAGGNWYRLLDHKAGALTRLALFDPATEERWEETVKPISLGAEHQLLYKRWVRSRRELVDRLSGGRLGYAHIRGMSDGPYREIFEEIFGRAVDKEAIILDTRFNGGGNLDEALTVFLSGKVFFREVPRGRQIGVEPSNRWTKPSIVVVNEGNYSDAHCFPSAYEALGLGETVGMPVPGTCTAVWWERLQDPSLVFGIPEVGIIDNAGDYLEGKQLEPDHIVDNDPALEAAGRDQQLEEAVSTLLAQLGPPSP